jgi:hypothetical protein
MRLERECAVERLFSGDPTHGVNLIRVGTALTE